MRPRCGTQFVSQPNRPGDTGTEPDTVIRSGNVIIHRSRDSDYFNTFLMKPLAITQGIVTANGNKVVNVKKLEVFQNLRGNIVDFLGVFVLEVRWHNAFG